MVMMRMKMMMMMVQDNERLREEVAKLRAELAQKDASLQRIHQASLHVAKINLTKLTSKQVNWA